MRSIYYFLISCICVVLLSTALWLQHAGYNGINYAPCPLCILQRVGYLGIAIACVIAAIIPKFKKVFHLLAIIASIYGLSTAIKQMWVIYHPTISCGIDPLEVFINQFALTQSVPWFFKADGFCSAPLPPLMGLSVPMWSLIWFSIFTLVLAIGFFKKSASK